ncbi:MAG TPA: riboflavin kinase, partial [Chitinophagaceae bacterium]|nr:riboflavin kinase [Chitinophagaceae bacterium]
PAQVLDDITVSSTRIRMALLKGDIDTANSCLGYHYHFEGLVVDGNKLGRTLGYPTANIHIHEPEKLVPGNGIYAVNVLLTHGTGNRDQAQQLMGMMSIGVRPTIGTTERTIEVNIFNFNEDIYGRILRVYIHKYLRPELKFNSLEELADALAQDKINALAALASHL